MFILSPERLHWPNGDVCLDPSLISVLGAKFSADQYIIGQFIYFLIAKSPRVQRKFVIK